MARRPTRSMSCKHFERRACFLQSLAEDDVIESLIGQVGQGFFEIAVKYRNAAGDGPLRLWPGDLDASRIHMFVRRQPRQQLAFAAAEIEDAGVGFNQFADDGVVAAAKQLADEGFGHAKVPWTDGGVGRRKRLPHGAG